MSDAHLDGPIEVYRHFHITTETEYRNLQIALDADRRRQGLIVSPSHVESAPAVAYVNHGRWVADCPCGNGMALHRGWPALCVVGCGAIYLTVQWPVDADDIEALLLARARAEYRNWRPGETVTELVAEGMAP